MEKNAMLTGEVVTDEQRNVTVPERNLPAPIVPAFVSHLESRNVKYSDVKLDVYSPYKNAKGMYVSRTAMQSEIFRVLHSMERGTPVTITGTDKAGNRIPRKVKKMMSTPVTSGKAYGEVSFLFTMPDGTEVIAEFPVHRIVAISGVVKGKGKEYTY